MILVQSLVTVHSFSSALKATLSLTVVKFTEPYKNCLPHITFDEHVIQKATGSIYSIYSIYLFPAHVRESTGNDQPAL